MITIDNIFRKHKIDLNEVINFKYNKWSLLSKKLTVYLSNREEKHLYDDEALVVKKYFNDNGVYSI